MINNITYKIVQWSTIDELHKECIKWLSQLVFIKNEQRFLDELIKYYTLPLISEKVYSNSLKIVGNLNKEEKEIEALIERCKDHANNIQTLLDAYVEPLAEQAYKSTHYYLKVEVNQYAENYKKTKEALFGKIKAIMKNKEIKSLPKK